MRIIAFELRAEGSTAAIMGETGRMYLSSISPEGYKCDCLDHQIRKRFCKHLQLHKKRREEEEKRQLLPEPELRT